MTTKTPIHNGCNKSGNNNVVKSVSSVPSFPSSDLYLELNISLLDKYADISSPLEYRLIVLLAQKMSFTGLQKNDDKILRSLLKCSARSFYRTVASLKARKIIGRDYFERLFLVELQGKPYSWKYLIDHLSANILKRSCWYYCGPRNKDNYGIIPINDVKYLYAHRLSWMIYNGYIPKRQVIHHKCRNPLCVRPDHLELVRSDRHSKKYGLSDFSVKNLDDIMKDFTAYEEGSSKAETGGLDKEFADFLTA